MITFIIIFASISYLFVAAAVGFVGGLWIKDEDERGNEWWWSRPIVILACLLWLPTIIFMLIHPHFSGDYRGKTKE